MKYIVRIQLLKLPLYEKPEPMLSNSAEYDSQTDAAELFKDLMRQMPEVERSHG